MARKFIEVPLVPLVFMGLTINFDVVIEWWGKKLPAHTTGMGGTDWYCVLYHERVIGYFAFELRTEYKAPKIEDCEYRVEPLRDVDLRHVQCGLHQHISFTWTSGPHSYTHIAPNVTPEEAEKELNGQILDGIKNTWR